MTTQIQLDSTYGPMREESPYPADWYIEDDEPVPVSRRHLLRSDVVYELLLGLQARTNWNAQVGKDLAHRWDPNEVRVGVDPDVYVLEPPPPEGDDVLRNRVWEPGHRPPKLAVEIVSESRPDKDYVRSPMRHELLGTEELWIFDPMFFGRSPQQPSVHLQMFRRTGGRLSRVYAGHGPMFSQALSAWVFVTDEDHIGIADDKACTQVWPTREEMALKKADDERVAKEQALKKADDERAAKEQALKKADDERAAKEHERSAKEHALARIAELEALLAERPQR